MKKYPSKQLSFFSRKKSIMLIVLVFGFFTINDSHSVDLNKYKSLIGKPHLDRIIYNRNLINMLGPDFTDHVLLAKSAYHKNYSPNPSKWKIIYTSDDAKLREGYNKLWFDILDLNDPTKNFYATVFQNQNNGKIVISFRGTYGFKGWVDNTLFHGKMDQEITAKRFVDKFKSFYRKKEGKDISFDDVLFVGDSKGGRLAITSVINYGGRAVTIDPLQQNNILASKEYAQKLESKVTNLIMNGEVLSSSVNRFSNMIPIGKNIYIENNKKLNSNDGFFKVLKTLGDRADIHSIDKAYDILISFYRQNRKRKNSLIYFLSSADEAIKKGYTPNSSDTELDYNKLPPSFISMLLGYAIDFYPKYKDMKNSDREIIDDLLRVAKRGDLKSFGFSFDGTKFNVDANDAEDIIPYKKFVSYQQGILIPRSIIYKLEELDHKYKEFRYTQMYGPQKSPLSPIPDKVNLPDPDFIEWTKFSEDVDRVFGLTQKEKEKPTPVIPPPVRDVPKQNTVNNQKPPAQEKPKHNDRGQDLTPDQGVATVQPPQGPTREYPVHQPSRPTSSNDDGVPPPQKAPNPNEHGVVSTGGGSNGLMPAPSPGRPTGGGDKLAPYQDEHAGNSSDPAYRPLPARPPKASDLAKAKELRERINRLNKMQDKLIYSFNAHKSQVESAIKENRVNDFIIDTAKLANSERKSALEIKEKVSDLEEEHEKITGSRNFRILYIDDPIDVDSLQNLISNQNKNRQTYQDLSEWGGVELDPEMASKLYSGDYLEKKYINGTPIKDFPTRGSAKYKGISDGKTVVKFQDTGEIHDSFQFHSDFGLEVNFERQTVTPSFSNIETYDHKNPSANTSWGIVNKNETYSDISISSFNGTAGFKGKATPQNCNQYCQDEEYQFVGAFSGPNAQQVSGIYQGKGKFKDSSNNSRDITSETMGIFGARRDNVHVPYVGLKDSSGIITSYDSLSEWGGITLNNDLKSKLPTNNYAGYNNFHATVENEIPKIGTADYYGSAQMQRINSQNKNVISQHTSDFEMSVNFQRQTVDSYFKNISPGAGLSHIDFEGVPIETYQHKILSDQQVTGFKRESKSAKIVGAFVGPKAEKTVGMFEVDVNQDAQLQGTFHGDKQ